MLLTKYCKSPECKLSTVNIDIFGVPGALLTRKGVSKLYVPVNFTYGMFNYLFNDVLELVIK